MFLNSIQKNKKTSLFFLNVFLCILIIFLLFYSAGCKTSETPVPNIVSGQTKLIVGTDPTYPNFEFIKDGGVIGFDIDIAGEIAGRMDRKLEIIQIEWDGSYGIPEDLEVDMIISAIPISSDKEGIVDFSNPYLTMEYMLIVLAETEIKVKEKLIGETVGILDSEKSYLSEDYLLDYKIEGYSDIASMINDLKNKDIDGILLSLPVGVNLVTGDAGIYKVLEVVKSNKDFAIVFRKENPLKEEINTVLDEIKEDGTFDEIYNKWFSYNS